MNSVGVKHKGNTDSVSLHFSKLYIYVECLNFFRLKLNVLPICDLSKGFNFDFKLSCISVPTSHHKFPLEMILGEIRQQNA